MNFTFKPADLTLNDRFVTLTIFRLKDEAESNKVEGEGQ